MKSTLLSVIACCCIEFSSSFVLLGKASSRTADVALNSSQKPSVVALTREVGKNEKLKKELLGRLDGMVQLEELPCIAHADGPDFDRLGDVLGDGNFDYVAVTSPEAARVLAKAWNNDDGDMPGVTAVGKATEAALTKFGIQVEFCPSKATAKTLVAELPAKGETTTLLYPASAKAATTLQDGLSERGFQVTRLNTYDTVTADWTRDEQDTSSRVEIVCFGSPSAVKGWLKNTGNNKNVIAACIGETSATECRKQEFPESRIHYPEKPGIPGWAEAVESALQTLNVVN